MKPADAIRHFGSISKLARALGLAPPTIHDWVNNGEIPESRQYQVQLASNGVLLADKPALRIADKEAA